MYMPNLAVVINMTNYGNYQADFSIIFLICVNRTLVTLQLEVTVATQSRELKQAKEKLTSHDTAARRTVAGLQSELKQKVEQVFRL